MLNYRPLIFLPLIIILSGCVSQNGGQTSDNEVITIDIDAPNRVIQDLDTEISLLISNNNDRTVENLNVAMTDTYGLKITSIDCDQGTENGNGCSFNVIDAFDDVRVVYKVKVPKTGVAISKIPLKPEITVNYDYSGQTVWTFPIIKKGSDIQVSGVEPKYTPGPIQVIVQKGLEATSPDEDTLIEDDIFSILVTVDDVIGGYGTIITKDNFWIELANLDVYGSGDGTTCDFEETSVGLTPKEDIQVPQEFPLHCVLHAKNNLQLDREDAVIEINFNYEYKIIKIIEMELLTQVR